MSTDARLSTGLPAHPKTKKLIRRCGEGGAFRLVCLILWVAGNRSDGDLAGMSDEDIELAADWQGEAGAFVSALSEVGFLDGEEGSRQLHDWVEHNPWAAGAEARSEKSRWAALCKQHGRREAARLMPDYAARLLEGATGKPEAVPESATGTPDADSGSAPSPLPSPSPSPLPSPEAEQSSLRSESGSQGEPLLTHPDSGEDSNVHQHPVERLVSTVLAAYHETLPKCRRMEALTPKRKKRVQAADRLARQVCRDQGWAYDAEAFWRAYFAECAKDPWMRGDVANPKNAKWKQHLEVLIDEDRFARVMDEAISAMREAA